MGKKYMGCDPLVKVVVVQCKKKVSWTMKVNRKVNPGTEMVTCLKVFFNEFN